jgi:hypothetical protein
MIISGLFALIGMILSGVLRSKFTKYSAMPMTNGMSGRDVAAAMLKYYGIYDVQITQVDGQLTDHYNPEDKTVNLSADVYNGQHVSAAAVAAHECGHAVQHAAHYPMLGLRSAMVPAVNIAASMQQYVLMFGLGAAVYFKSMLIAIVVLGIFMVTALFSLVTLPVEFDASRRALNWLDETGTAKGEQYAGAKDALTWAAMTYVSAALAAVVQLLYLAMQLLPIIMGGSRRNQA